MSGSKKIKSALVSAFYKDGLEDIVKTLNNLGVKIYSTGGTQSFIESLDVPVTAVEDLTNYPSILGGRVKTLHPKIFGGILGKREDDSHISQMQDYEIPEIDLVIVDLYPFEETVSSDASHADIIEKIDIGGISLIRAAAKNYNDVVIVPSVSQYSKLLEVLKNGKGFTTIEERRYFATAAFAVSSSYDSQIFNYFSADEYPAYRAIYDNSSQLRYGENPHQKGVFYGNLNDLFEQLHGKEISYNNLLDIDAAVSLISDFDDTTVAILKHNNACGLASRNSLVDAWKDALAGDPVSAFGGVVVLNKEVDEATAKEMDKIFLEVVIAPSYTDSALKILKEKKNRIILVQKKALESEKVSRTILNGVLVQDSDNITETDNDLRTVTTNSPTKEEIEDLIFANKIVKHSKSNAIVLAKNKQMISSGVGQTSRVDALKHSISKAESFGFSLNGAVMASDAFFPFADSVEIAHKAGITSVIQPGGSMRDQETIDFCNNNNISMVFTGNRHFKH